MGVDEVVKKIGFNTQPPEGGWSDPSENIQIRKGFNTQPPEGGWCISRICCCFGLTFQHTAA